MNAILAIATSLRSRRAAARKAGEVSSTRRSPCGLPTKYAVVLQRGDAEQILGQLAHEVAAAARIAGHERQVGVDRLVQVVVVDAVDDAIGEHRQPERRGAERADEIVEPARLVASGSARASCASTASCVLRAGDADDRAATTTEYGWPGVAARRQRRRRCSAAASAKVLRDRQRRAQRRQPRQLAHLVGRQRGARLDAELLAGALTHRRRPPKGGERLGEQRRERAPLGGGEAAEHLVLGLGQRLHQRLGLLRRSRSPA